MPQGAGIDRGDLHRMMAVLMICLMFLGYRGYCVYRSKALREVGFLMRIFSRTMKMWT